VILYSFLFYQTVYFVKIKYNFLKEAIMEKEIIFVVEESPEGGYEAKALGYPIFTEADSYEELKKMVQEAVSCHFEKKQRPKVIRLHMVKDELLTV
jgi:hypothetical protein